MPAHDPDRRPDDTPAPPDASSVRAGRAALASRSLSWRAWLLVAAAVLLGAGLQWAAVEASIVGVRVQQARTDLTSLRHAVTEGRADRLVPGADDLASHLRSAADHANSPPLRALSSIPLLRQDLRAARTALSEVAGVAQTGPSVAQAAAGVLDSATGSSPGDLAISAARALGPVLGQVCDRVDLAAARTAQTPPDGRLPFIASQVRRVDDTLDTARRTCADARSVLSVLPSALGVQGQRTYLLVFQNLAEARPTGGIVGSWALVTANRGRLALQTTGSNDDWTVWVNHAAELGPQAVQLYGTDMRRSQNVNLSPNFPYAGLLLSRVWQDQGHPPVDGVVSVDPVALSYLLGATGPVTVDGGPPLTEDDAVTQLTNTVYQELGGGSRQRLEYLGRVTGQVFAKLSDPTTDHSRLIAALLHSAREHHIMAWGPSGSDIATLASASDTDGALPAPAEDTVGVYTTNIDGSKLDYYARVRVTVNTCAGSPCVSIDLGNTAPATVAPYVGNQLPGATPTTRHTAVSLYLPPQRGVNRLTVDGRSATMSNGRELGWTVVRTAVDVPRGATVRLRFVLSGDRSPVRNVLTQPAISAVVVG